MESAFGVDHGEVSKAIPITSLTRGAKPAPGFNAGSKPTYSGVNLNRGKRPTGDARAGARQGTLNALMAPYKGGVPKPDRKLPLQARKVSAAMDRRKGRA